MTVKSKMSYEEWLELADEYYLAARSLQWFSGLNYPTTHAGHHALELYFKAISVRETGKYDNQEHDLRKLYVEAKRLDRSVDTKEVSDAIEKYWNYDQSARYTAHETKPGKLPANNAMGSDNLKALDFAVSVLRDLSVVTRRGLDRLVEGETEMSKAGISDPYLSLQSIILFHINHAFKPKTPEVMREIDYSAPRWKFKDKSA